MPVYRLKSDILGVDFGVESQQELTERDYFDILKTKVSPQKMLGVYRRNKDDEKVQSLATKALDNDFFDTGVGFATGFAEAGKSLGRGVKNMMVTNIAGTSRLLDASMQYGEPDESQRYDDLIEEGIKKAGQQLKGLSYASKRTDRTIEDDLSQALQFAGLSQEDENLKKRVIAEARRQDYAQTDATQAQAGVDALGMTTMLGAKLKQALGKAKDIVTGDTSFEGDSKERKLRELDYLVDQDKITRTMERGAELGLALTGQEESLRDVRSGLVEPDRDVALLGSIPLDPTLAPSMLASGGMAFGRNLIARGAINKFGKQAAEESALRATIAQISDVANPTATQKALLKTAEKKLQAVNGSGKKLEQLVAKSEGIAKTKAIDLIQKGQGNSPFTARILQAIDKTPAPKAPFTNRMTGKILEKAGISGEYLGRTIEFLQRLPEETLTTLFMRSGMDEQAAMSAARGTARTLQASAAAGVLTGGFSEFTPELENLGLALLLAPGGSSLVTRFGHDTAILGKQLQYAQSSLPLFQRIAQLDPADSSLTAVTLDRTSALTIPGTISGLAEGVFAKSRQFGPSPALKVPATALTRTGLGNTLTGAVNTAKTAIGATAIPGAIGYAIDGEAGAGGAIASSIPFIGAGLGLGTLARYGSKADIQAKMLGDESYYKDTYLNDADRVMYEGLKKPVRQALATSAIQNPDVIYKFIDKRGNSHWTVENGESVVTIYTKSAPQEQLSAVLGHEIAHHIDAFGFMPQILEQLVGSVEKGKPGIFTEYKNGKPVIIKDAEGRDVYATNKEFAKHRDRYLDLLEKSGTDKKHPDYQAYANDDARIAREVFASHGAAWYFGGDFVTRNYQGAGAKMMGAILEPLFSSPGLRKFFHRIGLATQENTGLVADPLNLFPGLKEIPQLTRMIEKYNDDVRGFGPQARREGRGRGNLVDPAFAEEIATVNLTAKDLENTAIVDRLKAGGVVKIKDDGTIETDAEGRPVFLPTREVNKKNKQLSNDILSIIRKKEDAGETFGEGHVALEKTADGRDRATGRFLDPSIIDELAQTGRYNPHQLAALKQISQTLRNNTGDEWNLFYYSALKYNKAGRKVYGQIKGGDRKSLPFGIEITKDGNINIQTISMDALKKNLEWFARSKGYEQKMAEAFQGMNAYENVKNAMKLLPTYLQNHMKGVINGSDGSGITPLQRDLINASIGRINADQVKANPILEGLGDRRSQRQQSYRSRRLDRIGNAIRGESGLPAVASAIEQNKVPMFMPGRGESDKLFMPASEAGAGKPGKGDTTPASVQSWDDANPTFGANFTKGMAKDNKEAAALLRKSYEDEFGEPVKAQDFTQEQVEWLGGMLAQEGEAALGRTGNAVNWYTSAVEKALSVAEEIFPEIGQKFEAKDRFLGALSITSQNMRVMDNAKAAVSQYQHKIRTGKFDYSIKHGAKADAITSNLKLYDKVEAKMGVDKLNDFLDADFTVKELIEWGRDFFGDKKFSIAGYSTDKVKGSAIFGPKIGQGFFQNLRGNYDPVTVDLWLRRTYGRLTGLSLDTALSPGDIGRIIYAVRNNKGKRKFAGLEMPEFLKGVSISGNLQKNGVANFKISDKAFESLFGDNTIGRNNYEAIYDFAEKLNREWERSFAKANTDVKKAKDAIKKAKKEDRGTTNLEKRLAKFEAEKEAIGKEKPQWAKAGSTVNDKLKPIDVPSNAERAVITKAFNVALKSLKEKGIDLTPADLQATLWYPEKDIWAYLKGENSDALNMSYDTAMEVIRDQR
jgi:hypothetical protein